MAQSISSSFPSGVPDPPIFSKLGPKDRSHLRNNIESLHTANMTTEQTFIAIKPDGVQVRTASQATAMAALLSIALARLHAAAQLTLSAAWPHRPHHLALREPRLQARCHQARHSRQGAP
ncbi:hypothetical protein OPT61_g9743 [Boeremia exigua]|uniref:Uncharacterized protein n=1 Tax=Boeremia exigua TaxID=749465 RepID=A0ACC2HSR5_9PLEO|nr:hypothetical protein OPT61_g9743 [Boeremia exigua]